MGASLPTPVNTPPAAGTSRCYAVTHKGVDLYVIDLAHTSPEEAMVIMKAAGDWIVKQPLNSVRAYTDGSGAVYSKQSYAALKAFTVQNTPHILASAVIGADGLRTAAMRAVALVTGRSIRPFATREDAWDWLASFT
jgi:hypothetical protein